MSDTFLIIGETSVARRVCASLCQRGFRVCHLIAPDDDELRESMSVELRGVAILARDDVVALRYALAAAHISPEVSMVVTIFDRTVADQLSELLPQCDVTSPADLAAPSLAGPCLDGGYAWARHDRAKMLAVRTADGGPESVLVGLPRYSKWSRVVSGATGALRTHDFGTRMLLGGLVGLFTILMTDWIWLTIGRGLSPLDAFGEAVRVVTTVGPATDVHDMNRTGESGDLLI